MTFAVLVLIIPGAVSSGSHDIALDSVIQKGITDTAAGRYDKALKTFNGVVKKTPDDPKGYFFLASVYNILSGYFDDLTYRDGFDNNASKALAISEARIKVDLNDAESFLLAGLTMGMLGMDAARRQSYGRAYLRSRKTIKYLERAIALNPDLGDAYYGLGVYYFWRARAKWLHRLAPLIGDTGEMGIRYLKRAAWSGRWLKDLARIELVYTLYTEKKFDEGRRLAVGLITEYPDQPHYRFAHAESYFIQKDFKRARPQFQEIHERFKNARSRFETLFRYFAEWRVVRCDWRLGNTEAARRGALAVKAKPDMGSSLMRRVRRAAVELVKLIDNEEDMVDRYPAPRKSR